MQRERVTLHKKRHAPKHQLTGGYVHAACGTIGRPGKLEGAVGWCEACDLAIRAERDGNKDLMAA